MDADFLQEMIDALKAQIRALNTTILALSTKQQYSYTEDTGQGRVTVTRQDLPSLYKARDAALNELATLCARQNGGSVSVSPLW